MFKLIDKYSLSLLLYLFKLFVIFQKSESTITFNGLQLKIGSFNSDKLKKSCEQQIKQPIEEVRKNCLDQFKISVHFCGLIDHFEIEDQLIQLQPEWVDEELFLTISHSFFQSSEHLEEFSNHLLIRLYIVTDNGHMLMDYFEGFSFESQIQNEYKVQLQSRIMQYFLEIKYKFTCSQGFYGFQCDQTCLLECSGTYSCNESCSKNEFCDFSLDSLDPNLGICTKKVEIDPKLKASGCIDDCKKGKCFYHKNKRICRCAYDRIGPLCSYRICMAHDNLCLNKGMCNQVSLISNDIEDHKSVCICNGNYQGELCEQEIKCPTDYCKNNGICKIINKEPQCICKKEYTGELCETLNDQCPFCYDGFICILEEYGYRCVNKNPSNKAKCSIDCCIKELINEQSNNHSYSCSLSTKEIKEIKDSCQLTMSPQENNKTSSSNDEKEETSFHESHDHFNDYSHTHNTEINKTSSVKYVRAAIIAIIISIFLVTFFFLLFFHNRIKAHKKMLETAIIRNQIPLNNLNCNINNGTSEMNQSTLNRIIKEKPVSHYYSSFIVE